MDKTILHRQSPSACSLVLDDTQHLSSHLFSLTGGMMSLRGHPHLSDTRMLIVTIQTSSAATVVSQILEKAVHLLHVK